MDYLSEYLLFCKSRKTNNNLKTAQLLAKRGYNYIFNSLCEAFINRFVWRSEEQTIATDLIELTILFNDACAFHKYKNSAWLNFKPVGILRDSFYGKASRCELLDYFGRSYGQHLVYQESDTSDIADTVLIYDNAMMTSALSKILFFTQRLGEINSSINACISNITGTQILAGTREQVKALKDLMNRSKEGLSYAIVEYDEANPASYNLKMLQSSDLKDVLVTLFEAWDKTYADFLQSIGIRANTEINKKSGVTPLELTENRQNTDLILNAALEARTRGISHCEKIGLEGLTVSLSNFEPKTSAIASHTIAEKGGIDEEEV